MLGPLRSNIRPVTLEYLLQRSRRQFSTRVVPRKDPKQHFASMLNMIRDAGHIAIGIIPSVVKRTEPVDYPPVRHHLQILMVWPGHGTTRKTSLKTQLVARLRSSCRALFQALGDFMVGTAWGRQCSTTQQPPCHCLASRCEDLHSVITG